MIRINLIPLEDRPRPRQVPLPSKLSMIIYGLAILAVITCVATYFVHAKALGQLEIRLAELKEQEKEVAAQTRAIEELEVRSAMLQERLDLLQQLENRRFTNVEWLNTLNTIIPGRLWLQQIMHNQQNSRSTIEGIAAGYRPISNLMRAMEDSGRFTVVQLIKAERQTTDKVSVIHFTVAASWQATPLMASANWHHQSEGVVAP